MYAKVYNNYTITKFILLYFVQLIDGNFFFRIQKKAQMHIRQETTEPVQVLNPIG